MEEQREHLHVRVSPAVRRALRMVAAERGDEQSAVVEAALRKHPQIKAKLANGQEAS